MARLFVLIMGQRSGYFEKGHRPGLTDRTGTIGFPFMGVAANFTDIVVNILVATEIVKRRLIKVSVNLLDCVGQGKTAQGHVKAFTAGLFHHLWVHAGKLMSLTADGLLKIFRGTLDSPQGTQMSVSMHRFSGGGGTEQFGDLLMPFSICLVGKCQVLAVGL